MSDIFYRSFEEKHRGSVEEIKGRLAVYLPYIAPLSQVYPEATVADLGCGRGEWLELLKEQNIPAIGVDIDEGMLARAVEIGLNVKKQDAIEFLQQQADQSLLCVSGFHIAEHLPFEVLQALVKETLRVLKPGGLLILETPNPENISVGACSFYMDPTHQQPLPPALLEFLPYFYGFQRTKILRLQENPSLKQTELSLNLTDVLKGVSPDYSVMAQKQTDTTTSGLLNRLFDQEHGVSLDDLSHRYDSQQENRFNQHTQLITEHSQHLQAINQQLQQLQQTTEAYQNELLSLYNSKSWRITAPLRWLFTQGRRIQEEGIKTRATKAIKKVLRKLITTGLVIFKKYPQVKKYALLITHKLGIHQFLKDLANKLQQNTDYDSNHLLFSQHTTQEADMNRRAIAIYQQLKDNKNNKGED